jgi:hypothetical protein
MADATTQKNNFTVEFGNSQYGIIKLFLVINEKPYSIMQEITEIKSVFKLNTADSKVNLAIRSFSKFYKKVKINNKYSLVDCESFQEKCILLFIKDEIYLTPLVDLSEFD